MSNRGLYAAAAVAAILIVAVIYFLIPKPLDITCRQLTDDPMRFGPKAARAIWDNLPSDLKTVDLQRDLDRVIRDDCRGPAQTMRETRRDLVDKLRSAQSGH
jgi:hypothetical protein